MIEDSGFSGYKNKLKGRLFGLLCEREKNGEWEKFLDTIMVELYGFANKNNSINYYTILGKMSCLKMLNYEYFRKTIFECMGLVEGIDNVVL